MAWWIANKVSDGKPSEGNLMETRGNNFPFHLQEQGEGEDDGS